MAALPYEDDAATALDGDPYALLLIDEIPLPRAPAVAGKAAA